MKHSLYPALGLFLLLPVIAGAQSLGAYPAEEYCSSSCYSGGYNAGLSSGYNQGNVAGIEQCVADPSSCGISLAACMDDLDVVNDLGEVEPNDNLISANPLPINVNVQGQSYSAIDQDWFYVITTTPNQNLLVNFSIPTELQGEADSEAIVDLTLAGWTISVRDASGNILAEFDTGTAGSTTAPTGSVTYRTTLGFASTYYIVVQPNDPERVHGSYTLSAVLQQTDQDTPNYLIGFHDTELEPNNLPAEATELSGQVTMYGLINLTFDSIGVEFDEEEPQTLWLQGEEDWFFYDSEGNEIITLSFCSREECEANGNWQVEVYDSSVTSLIENQLPQQDLGVTPLLAFNTDNGTDDVTETFTLGLTNAGRYYLRVTHRRLKYAPCAQYQFTSLNSEDGFGGLCNCDSGTSCYIPSDNCQDGDSGLFCQTEWLGDGGTCVVGVEPGCSAQCEMVQECETVQQCEDVEQCNAHFISSALCSCSEFGEVILTPESEDGVVDTTQYNFTWQSTRLPPNSANTEAYDDMQNRPTPY